MCYYLAQAQTLHNITKLTNYSSTVIVYYSRMKSMVPPHYVRTMVVKRSNARPNDSFNEARQYFYLKNKIKFEYTGNQKTCNCQFIYLQTPLLQVAFTGFISLRVKILYFSIGTSFHM